MLLKYSTAITFTFTAGILHFVNILLYICTNICAFHRILTFDRFRCVCVLCILWVMYLIKRLIGLLCILQRRVRRGAPGGREVDRTQLRRQVHQHAVPAGQEHGEEWDQHHESAAPSQTTQPTRRLRGPAWDGHGPWVVSIQTSTSLISFFHTVVCV